ncbi:MAG TPA: hypothetical protein VGR35_09470 [Tepidisphaeraceae bacterium]|nr:hypothetical protein [Tepidisphaeraceae bacterium]
MALTNAQIQRLFKIIGKVIFFAQVSVPQSDGYRKLMSGLVDQTSSGLSSDADTQPKFTIPAIQAIHGTVVHLDGVPATAKGLGETLLRQVTAVDLGLRAGAQLGVIGTALVADMNAASETVAPSGENGSNSNGYAVYFAREFGIVLPQNPVPTILDSWVDDDVI